MGVGQKHVQRRITGISNIWFPSLSGGLILDQQEEEMLAEIDRKLAGKEGGAPPRVTARAAKVVAAAAAANRNRNANDGSKGSGGRKK